MAVLHQFEHDVGVDGVRVKALIGRLVVRLEFHNGVLAHGDIEVLLHFFGTEDESLDAARCLGFGRVGMDGNEQVRVVLVGYVGALLERNEHIRSTCEDHFDIGVLLFEQFADLERQFEIEIFLLGDASDGTGIFSSVTGVEDDGITFGSHHRQPEEENYEKKQLFSHFKPI